MATTSYSVTEGNTVNTINVENDFGVNEHDAIKQISNKTSKSICKQTEIFLKPTYFITSVDNVHDWRTFLVPHETTARVLDVTEGKAKISRIVHVF